MLKRTLSAAEREVASVVLRGAGAHRIPGMGINEGADSSAQKVVGLGAGLLPPFGADMARSRGERSDLGHFGRLNRKQPLRKRGASGGDDQRCVRFSSRIATP